VKKYYILLLSFFCISLPLQSFTQKKSGFSMWFTGKEDISKKKKNKHKHHYMKIFDTYAIFDFDKELNTSIHQTKNIQKDFTVKMRYLQSDIKHLEKELIYELDENKKGSINDTDILLIYKKLYQLLKKKNTLISNHTIQIMNIFNTTYSNYSSKVQSKINSAEQDPIILTEELMTRYNIYLKELEELDK